ncbi:MAG: hypothetical protein C4346_06535, partial [Chloroflexota bacterium]
EEGGRSWFRRAWTRGPRPTALVAMSDAIALGALSAALQCGLRVPDDLSLVGFDDIPEAAWVQPALTTVRQPTREKGTTAAELLIALVNRTGEPRHIQLETHLVRRATVAPPSCG